MLVSEIEARVAEIEQLGEQDNGRAHEKEDALFLDVLAAIASGQPDAQSLAAAAIRSAELDINRWTE